MLGSRREYKVKQSAENKEGNSRCPSQINNSVTPVGSLVGTTTIAEISLAHALCF